MLTDDLATIERIPGVSDEVIEAARLYQLVTLYEMYTGNCSFGLIREMTLSSGTVSDRSLSLNSVSNIYNRKRPIKVEHSEKYLY